MQLPDIIEPVPQPRLRPEQADGHHELDDNGAKNEPQKVTKRYDRSHFNVVPNQIISSSSLRHLVELLDQDAKSCYDGLQEFENLANTGIPEQFRSTYELFDTVPVLFLSVDRSEELVIKAIYLWQINKFCPWVRNMNTIKVDLTLNDTDIYARPSFLMLLKIEPKQGETLISARLLPGGRLLVKSILGDSQIIFKIFNASDFYANVKINPFKKVTSRNHEYSITLVLERVDENTKSDWKMTLYRPMTSSELDTTIQNISLDNTLSEADGTEKVSQTIITNKLVESKVIENSGGLSEKEILSEVQMYAFGESIIFFDKKDAKVIKLNLESLEIVCIRELGTIEVVEALNESLFVVSKDDKIFQLTFAEGINIKTIKLSSPLPPDSISTETKNIWRFIHLLDPISSESVLHAIFLRKNKFYAIPLDECKQNVQILARKPDYETINRDWDIFTYVESSDTVNLRIPILVYISNNSICFYNMLDRRENSIPFAIPSYLAFDKYKLIKATIGRAYLLLEGTGYGLAAIFEVRYCEDLDDLFAKNDLATDSTELSRIFGNASEEDIFLQAEGNQKQITLAKFGGSEVFYQDEINCFYLGKISLKNLEKQKQINQLKKANAQAIQPSEEEETKQDNTQKVVQKTAEAKKYFAQADSKQTLISNCNTALSEVRKQISTEAAKIFKTEQDSLKRSKHAYNNPYNQAKASKVSVPSTVPKEYLNAYKDLKDEKKKAAKQREKEKGKKQNWKNSETEF